MDALYLLLDPVNPKMNNARENFCIINGISIMENDYGNI